MGCAVKHRLENFAESSEYEAMPPDEHKVFEFRYDRHTSKYRLQANYKGTITKDRIVGYFAVAWAGTDPGDSKSDLDSIDPLKNRAPWPQTFVLIGWKSTYGVTQCTWEIRDLLYQVYDDRQYVDHSIFVAACAAERRYEEAMF